MCQNEYYSQKVTACLYDESLVTDENSRYIVATSLETERPLNARPECGVNFLPWSPEGDGFSIAPGRANHDSDGYIIVRNMMPQPAFTQAIQNTRAPGDEETVLGDYMPKGRYLSRADFEALGCSELRAALMP